MVCEAEKVYAKTMRQKDSPFITAVQMDHAEMRGEVEEDASRIRRKGEHQQEKEAKTGKKVGARSAKR